MIEAGYSTLGSSLKITVGLRDLSRTERLNILHDLLRDTGLEMVIATNPEFHKATIAVLKEFREGN